ncbi:MAG TPA: hypothetical protein VH120_20830 [Gemmataceae bacterium]|nr:hypothetical protein [Gemmataceae bacterium]
MKVAIEVDPRDKARAWGLLVRGSPGMVLPGGVFVISEDAVRALREAGVKFTELSREGSLSGATAGERI